MEIKETAGERKAGETLKQLNRSGFPFQLKVEDDIRAAEQDHKWYVASREQLVVKASAFEVEADLGARIWDDVRLLPDSLESHFCVLQVTIHEGVP